MLTCHSLAALLASRRERLAGVSLGGRRGAHGDANVGDRALLARLLDGLARPPRAARTSTPNASARLTLAADPRAAACRLLALQLRPLAEIKLGGRWKGDQSLRRCEKGG